MDYGRVHAVIIANTAGRVVYERFYDAFTDLERADIRAACSGVSEPYPEHAGRDGAEAIGCFRSGVIVARWEADLVLYALGSGEYEELQLAEVLRALAAGLAAGIKRALSEAHLFEAYTKVALVVDEMICEGILDVTDKEQLLRNIKLKAAE